MKALFPLTRENRFSLWFESRSDLRTMLSSSSMYLTFFLISLRQERRIINLKVALKNIVDKNYKGSAGFARTFSPTRIEYCQCFVKRNTNTEQFMSFSCQMKENSKSCSTVLMRVHKRRLECMVNFNGWEIDERKNLGEIQIWKKSDQSQT